MSKGIIRYVIVVHGIGEQRKNETVLNVINQFARSRKKEYGGDTLTLGKITGETGRRAASKDCRYNPPTTQYNASVEFEGISVDSETPVTAPFYGDPVKNGENIRFADLCWSDIMNEDIDDVGQDIEQWVRGLLGRLRKKSEFNNVKPQTPEREAKRPPKWILIMLSLLAKLLFFVKYLMSFRYKELKDLIFTKFLGDVELYGE